MSHSNHRSSGKLHNWVLKNSARLANDFNFGKTMATVLDQVPDPEKNPLHTCDELVRCARNQNELPQCCKMVALANLPPLAQTEIEAQTLDDVFEDADFDFLNAEEDLNACSGNVSDIFSEFLTVELKDSSLDPILMLQVKGVWGCAGCDLANGMVKVSIGSVLGLDLIVRTPVEVKFCLIDSDRQKTLDATVKLEPRLQKMHEPLIKLPSPTKSGVHIMDISLGNERPITVPYMVFQLK